MSELAIRLVVQVGIVVLGFVAYVGSVPGSGLILFYPFFLGIPAILLILIVFTPIERVSASRERAWIGYLAVPMASALITGLALRNPEAALYGALWGALWVVTGWVYRAALS